MVRDAKLFCLHLEDKSYKLYAYTLESYKAFGAKIVEGYKYNALCYTQFHHIISF